MVSEKDISTIYVNQYYFDTDRLRERSSEIQKKISAGIPVNSSFHPVMYFYQISWWLGLFPVSPWLIAGCVLVFFLLLMVVLNPVNTGLFCGGFTLASTEVILLVALQVLYGFVFQMVGLVIMIFMLGLAIGSKCSERFFTSASFRYYILFQAALTVLSLALPFLLVWMTGTFVSDNLIKFTLVALTFIASVVVGMEYGLSVHLSRTLPSSCVPVNYSAELFGAAAGAFLVAVFIFPRLGLVNTGIFLGILNATGALLVIIRRRFFISL
jgi:spermidine synthase